VRHEGAGSVNLNPDLRRTSHGRLCLGAIGGLARGRPYFQGMERPRPREKAFIEKPRPGQGLEGASKPHHRKAISIGLGLVAQAQRLRKCKGLHRGAASTQHKTKGASAPRPFTLRARSNSVFAVEIPRVRPQTERPRYPRSCIPRPAAYTNGTR